MSNEKNLHKMIVFFFLALLNLHVAKAQNSVDKVGFTLFDDFETGELYRWESHPYSQDTVSSRKIIMNLINNSWEALSHQDLERFRQYITKDWNLYTALGNKMDAEHLFELHRRNMNNFHLKPTRVKIHVYDGVAWATYDAHVSGVRNGMQWSDNFIFTEIFVQSAEGWRIIHTHETKIQQSNNSN